MRELPPLPRPPPRPPPPRPRMAVPLLPLPMPFPPLKLAAGALGALLLVSASLCACALLSSMRFHLLRTCSYPNGGLPWLARPAFSRMTVLKSSSTRSARFLHTKEKFQSFSCSQLPQDADPNPGAVTARKLKLETQKEYQNTFLFF
jgi:hypothetical protein